MCWLLMTANKIWGVKVKVMIIKLTTKVLRNKKNVVDQEANPKWLSSSQWRLWCVIVEALGILDSSLYEGQNVSPLPEYDTFKWSKELRNNGSENPKTITYITHYNGGFGGTNRRIMLILEWRYLGMSISFNLHLYWNIHSWYGKWL